MDSFDHGLFPGPGTEMVRMLPSNCSLITTLLCYLSSYVQHKIRENAMLIKKALVVEKGIVLVAGNAKNMPKAVKEAIIEVVGDEDYVEHMIKTKRYQEETWS